LVEEWDGDLAFGYFGWDCGRLFGFCCVTMNWGSDRAFYGYGVV
jgi:hypothetical protein